MHKLMFQRVDSDKHAASLETVKNLAEVVAGARPDWPEYWLNIAAAVASRSTCMQCQAGAVLVDTHQKIVSTGYNGAFSGAPNCSDRGECMEKRGRGCDIVHAECNAVLSARPESAAKGTMYVVAMHAGELADSTPCEMCFRVIRNAGIERIVYVKPDGRVLSLKTGWPS